jgi:hypothetical protein
MPLKTSHMLKVEMLSRVSRNKSIYENNVTDEMDRAQNKYHCGLSPFELIWAQVKGYVATQKKPSS